MSETGTKSVADAKWYIVHTYSNFEKKVKEEILRQAKIQDLEEFVADVVVPTEEVMEVRRGQKVKAEHKFLPGYVLLSAKLTCKAGETVSVRLKPGRKLAKKLRGKKAPKSLRLTLRLASPGAQPMERSLTLRR